MSGEFDPIRVLRILEKHRVKFVIVGGFAAWMQGAPIVTTDVDIVYEATPKNITVLIKALRELGAVYRHQLNRRIEPSAEGLASTVAAGHHLLETNAGNLDVLRTASGVDYLDLIGDAIELEIEGRNSRYASLKTVIAMKERAGREKDIAALPTLKAALGNTES